jgi:hypothetical protein
LRVKEKGERFKAFFKIKELRSKIEEKRVSSSQFPVNKMNLSIFNILDTQ